MDERSELSEAEREASRWLVRLESPDVTFDDHKRFRTWLNASADNRAAFEAVSGTWDRLDALKHLTPEPQRRVFARPTVLAAAGLALIAAIFVGFVVLAPTNLPPGVVYATGIGQRQTIRLDDGSTVELDAGSRATVLYARDRRTVRLAEGVALFDVRADAARPFVVETAYGDVRVHGTAFLMRLGDRQLRTTVLRGVVEGKARREGLLSLIPQSDPASPVLARANQEIAFDPDGLTVRDVAPQAAERRLAWRSGMLAFDGETLREAVAEVERQTGTRFDFADARLGDLRVGGYISARDSDAFTQLLRDSLNLEASRRSDGVIVLRRIS